MIRLKLMAFALFAVAGCVATKLHGETLSSVSPTAVSPEVMTQRIEAHAQKNRQSAGSIVGSSLVNFGWPSSVEECQALGSYIVLLVSIISRNPGEFPVRRLYVSPNAPDYSGDIELQQLSSMRLVISEGLLAASILGRYREDGLYLAPATAVMRRGRIEAEYGAIGFPSAVSALPPRPPDNACASRIPQSSSAPNRDALRAFIRKEYPGYPF
jgi:hypothetical protein